MRRGQLPKVRPKLPSFVLPSLKRLQSLPLETIKSKIASNRKGRHTGTTLIALRFNSGAILAGDRQISIPPYRIFGEERKIQAFSDLSCALGMSGTVGCIQELFDIFPETVRAYRRFMEAPISIEGQACIMTDILRANFETLGIMQYLLDYTAYPLLVGWDRAEKRVRIFQFEESGAQYEAKAQGYAVVGSGEENAQIVLDDRWDPRSNREQALNLIVRALYRSGARDPWTGHGLVYSFDAYTITEQGVRRVARETLDRYIRRISQGDATRRAQTRPGLLRKGGAL